MSLTGTALLALLIALCTVVVLGTLFLWPSQMPRHASSGVRRCMVWLTRLLLIGLCQATAIAAVAGWINDGFGLYTSWGDLLGTTAKTEVTAAGGMAGPPAISARFTRGSDAIFTTYFRGHASHLAGQVRVWTPPQYDEPAYRHSRFPVVMLLHGVPGSPESWIEAGGFPRVVKALLAEDRVKPFILVLPVINPGYVDTDCSDIGSAKNATWLVKDVRGLVDYRFRTISGPRGWGLMGISTGGLCAAKLPLQFPDVFRTGVSLDPDPMAGDPDVISQPTARRLNSPLWLVRHHHPRVSLLLATSSGDRSSPPANIEALRLAARRPTDVTALILASGGHNWHTWQQMYPTVLPWLSSRLSSPEPL
jgi:enterochelin esterase-like enzyme